MRLSRLVLICWLATGAPAWPQAAAPRAARPHKRRALAPDPEKEALRKRLAEATSTIGTLDSRVLGLMADIAAMRQQLESASAARADLQHKLDAANESLASFQTRVKTAEERAEKLAAEKSRPAPAASPAVRAPGAEEARLQSQLDDINRRRDAYIASVLRRYRELANEYRSFGAVSAVPNDRELTAKSGPDLTRIQNTIAMVEEDLRQLNGLDAQAVLVRKSQAKLKTP